MPRLMLRSATSILLLLTLFPSRNALAQAENDSTNIRMLPPEFYGSIRVRYAVTNEGRTEVSDRFSRLGVNLRANINDDWAVVSNLEPGINIVNQNPAIVVGGDQGYRFGEGGNAVVTRIGYAGITSPYGTLTFGKQWAVYYDIAGYTDMFYTFGGEASGAYAQSDGGIEGTGRAERAVQYRVNVGPIGIGLQTQARNRTANSQLLADTWSAKVEAALPLHLSIGAAYNEVRDGVPDPEPNEPKLGSKAMVGGLLYKYESVYVAMIYARSDNHESDDLGEFYRAHGTELFAYTDISARWFIYGGFNYLSPIDRSVNKFRLATYNAGIGYRVAGPLLPGPPGSTGNVLLTLEFRFDDNLHHDGSKSGESVAVFGFNIGW